MNEPDPLELGVEYYAQAAQGLKRLIESDDHWTDWTASDKRYMLVTHLLIVEGDVDGDTFGRVTGYLDFHVSSTNVEDLRRLWESSFIRTRYSTTHQHFIVDMKDRKVVEFLSICA